MQSAWIVNITNPEAQNLMFLWSPRVVEGDDSKQREVSRDPLSCIFSLRIDKTYTNRKFRPSKIPVTGLLKVCGCSVNAAKRMITGRIFVKGEKDMPALSETKDERER